MIIPIILEFFSTSAQPEILINCERAFAGSEASIKGGFGFITFLILMSFRSEYSLTISIVTNPFRVHSHQKLVFDQLPFHAFFSQHHESYCQASV